VGPNDVTVFRPELGAVARLDDVRARWLVFLVIEIALGLLLLSHFVGVPWGGISGVVVVMVIIGIGLAWLALYQANAKIEIAQDDLVLTDFLGHRRHIARTNVSQFVRLSLRPFEGPPRPVVLALDVNNRFLFGMGTAWPVQAIIEAIGIPVKGSYSDTRTAGEINRMYPGTSSRWAAHPAQLVVIAFGATVIAAIGAFIVFANFHD